jgi:hypothetical protein
MMEKRMPYKVIEIIWKKLALYERIILRYVQRNNMGYCGLDGSVSGLGHMAGSFEHYNDRSDYIQWWEFLTS